MRTKKSSRGRVFVRIGYPSLAAVVMALTVSLFALPVGAQVAPSATRPSSIFQVGAQFPWASSDYASKSLEGYGFYATYHLVQHFRIEGDFRQLDNPGAKAPIYERTFELGPQYDFRSGPFRPYVKAMYGRGVFNFPPSPQNPAAGAVANLAYNMFAAGGGVEYRLQKPISLRLDYEYQQWIGFPPHGLNPQVVSVGVAYRFH